MESFINDMIINHITIYFLGLFVSFIGIYLQLKYTHSHYDQITYIGGGIMFYCFVLAYGFCMYDQIR